MQSMNTDLENQVKNLQKTVDESKNDSSLNALQLECKVLKDLLTESKNQSSLKITQLELSHTQKLAVIKQEYESKLEKSLRTQIRMENEREKSPVLMTFI